jgi:hypothetical protein
MIVLKIVHVDLFCNEKSLINLSFVQGRAGSYGLMTWLAARDKKASARFFAQLFGLSLDGHDGHFAPVRAEVLHCSLATAQKHSRSCAPRARATPTGDYWSCAGRY